MKKHIVQSYLELDHAKTLCGKYLKTIHTCSGMLGKWATCKTCLKIYEKHQKWKQDVAKVFKSRDGGSRHTQEA